MEAAARAGTLSLTTSGSGKTSARSSSCSVMMSRADPDLIAEAERFAEEIADLLHRTVRDDPPIRALTVGNRVVVAPYSDEGDKLDVAMTVAGEHRLDLRIDFRCHWDFTG